MGVALAEVAADLSHVVQTRTYLADGADWENVGRAYGEVFADSRPAATLLDYRMLVEIEIEIEIEAVAYVEE